MFIAKGYIVAKDWFNNTIIGNARAFQNTSKKEIEDEIKNGFNDGCSLDDSIGVQKILAAVYYIQELKEIEMEGETYFAKSKPREFCLGDLDLVEKAKDWIITYGEE